jgi:1-acyl-sn-glycerol-3-phosphate acyltransferase
MRWLLSIFVWAYWTICFFLVLAIVSILFLFTWPFDRFRKIPNSALKLLAWLIMKPIPSWSFKIEGTCRDKITRPTIVVANHQSFLDIPLLYLLPWNMKWVTKRSMRKIPVLGWMITMTGHIPIDRKSLQSFRAMDALVEPIKSGIPGMIFPEGTRTGDGSVQSFKRGAFRIAKQYDFQVLPVVVNGGFRCMPRGHWEFGFHNQFVISVLKPVSASDFKDAESLKNNVKQLIEKELGNIQRESNP